MLQPPAVLSKEKHSPYFHPCYERVGVLVNGVERNDLLYYSTEDLSYQTIKRTSHLAESIETFWRYPENRQQRRARERWEAKHPRRKLRDIQVFE